MWPILTSFALLTLTVSAVLYFHGFVNGGELLTLGFILVSGAMVLWFRDVITEGTKKISSILTTTKALSKEDVIQEYNKYCEENSHVQNSPYKSSNSSKELGYYLAGLLEVDGSINIPSLGKTSLKRVLNPRIVFTSPEAFERFGVCLHYYKQNLDTLGDFKKVQIMFFDLFLQLRCKTPNFTQFLIGLMGLRPVLAFREP